MASFPTAGNDTIVGTNGDDTIDGLSGNDWILTFGGNDTLGGNIGDDALDGGGGFDTMYGAAGNDTYVVHDTGSLVVETAGPAQGTADKILSYISYNMLTSDFNGDTFGDAVNVENIRLVTQHNWSDVVNGTFTGVFAITNNAVIAGNTLDNSLEGDGGIGITLAGGTGNDTYIEHALPGAPTADTIIENVGEGSDTIFFTPLATGAAYSLATLANVENITLGGSIAYNAVGNALDNILTGNAGTNTLTGGIGNDTYVVQSLLDKVVENAGEGTHDAVSTAITYSLATLPNVEDLILTGTANVNGTGNANVNTISGNDGNNILDGVSSPGGVGDTYVGSLGNDTYMVHTITDTVIIDPNVLHPPDAGTDLILATLGSGATYDMLGNALKVDNLTLLGAGASNVYGNDLANTIIGNSANNIIYGVNPTFVGSGGNDSLLGGGGNDTLFSSGGTCHIDGGTGADTMYVGAGNDQFYVDSGADFIFAASIGDIGGFDGINASVSFNMLTNAGDASGETGLILTGTLAINGTGNNLGDTIDGNSGINVLTGGAGIDTIRGNGGTDKLFGLDGDDTLIGGSVADTLDGGNGNDILIGGAGNDVLIGGAGNDNLKGEAGTDTLNGGAGDDTYNITDTTPEVIIDSSGIDTVASNVSFSLENLTMIENLSLGPGAIIGIGNLLANVIQGNANSNTLSGLGGNDTITGNGGNDTIDGGTGADTMTGNVGNDVYFVDNVGDVVLPGPGPSYGIDTIMSSITFDLTTTPTVNNLTLIGTAAINGTGNTLDNVITGNGALNTLAGGMGSDTYVMNNTTDVLIEATGVGAGTHDAVIASVNFNLSSALYLPQEIEDLTLTGSSAIFGTGNALNNIITATGGGIINTLSGLDGNDTYVVDAADVILVDTSGNDTVQVGATYSIAARLDLENITLTGGGDFGAIGNTDVNILTGNSGNNVLDARLSGGLGDTYVGSFGNDTYMIDEGTDTVIAADQGTDLAIASVNYDMTTLAAVVDNLTLTGTALQGTGNALDNVITGNAFDNTLTGLGGNDTFHGGGGSDTMIGGTGNETYFVDNSSDVITEVALQGTDTVLASVNYDMSLNATGAVEILTLTGSALIGIGNASDNTITGNTGNNTLDGGAGNDTIDGGAATVVITGADTMIGGTGNDTFIVHSLLDVVSEASGGGTDLIKSNISYTLHASTISEVENLTLTGTAVIGVGNDLANTITGTGGVNTLDGQLGADSMIGGGGADTYMVDNAADTVIGIGLVVASANYDMSAHATSATNLTLTGPATVGTGNGVANIITTDNLVNTVSGGTGSDTLILHSASDIVLDTDAGTTDSDVIMIDTGSIGGATSYNMLTNASGTRGLTITGTGNFDVTCSNILGGGPAPQPTGDTITGNSGINHFIGGTGDDTFFVGANDFVVDIASLSDSDTVGIAFTLNLKTDEALGGAAHWQGIENIILTGTGALNATGDAATNTLTGNSGINILDDGGIGGAGDTMIGGAGNDTYHVNNSADIIDEQHNSGAGTDIVFSTVSFSIGPIVSEGVENLTLLGTANIDGFGNNSANIIVGNSGNNFLSGGAGVDTMNGGLGDDTYGVDSTDVIIDSGGHDLVIENLTTYTLPTGMEDLTLAAPVPTNPITGIGNAAVNIITGNSLDNTLDGKAGADTMYGGDGNDTFFVDNLLDVVHESADTGTLPGAGTEDLIITGLNYTLPDASNPTFQVENLTLTGTAVFGTGNDLNNTLTGNGGSNTLTGGLGNDYYDGGLGKDVYHGGPGSNTFVIGSDAVTNHDTVFGYNGTDILEFSSLLIGFDPLKNVLDDFIAIRYDGTNSLAYVDRDGVTGTQYTFQLVAVIEGVDIS